MDAVLHGVAVFHRASASTGYGDVYLESRYEDATRIAVRALKEYDNLVAQRDALVAACKALVSWIGPPPTDPHSYDSAREDAWEKARAALALVKGEQ